MARRKCPYCIKKVHHKATVCPYCQKEIKPISFWKTRSGILLIIIGILTVIGMVASEPPSKKTVQQTAPNRELTKEQREQNNKIREQELLAKVQKLPASLLKENRDAYKELLGLNPAEQNYQEKLKYYDLKFKEQEKTKTEDKAKAEKEHEVRVAKFGEPPVQSAWDGSYRVINKYLERVAKDPDSVKIETCTSVYHTDSGWLVGCDWRAKNSFGGYVRDSNWFIIRYEKVVEMKDFSAYKLNKD